MRITNKSTRQDAIRKVMAGMSKYYGNLPSVRLAGTVFTPAALLQFLQADIASSDAADQARADLLKAVEAQTATRGKTNVVLRAIKSLVFSDQGDSKDVSDVLAFFGYSPRTRKKASAEENALAAAKRNATRKARGTVGKKARGKIHGTVPAATSSGTPAPGTNPVPKS